MSYSPAYMQPSSLMEGQESSQLYSSAMQLTSYASNIMGHTMNQYAAQSSLLSSQVSHSQSNLAAAGSFRLTPDYFQISPVNNNISKTNFAGQPPTPPPPAVTISTQSQMGSSSFSQTAAPIGHTSTSFTPPTSFPRQQFPSSAAMYGWY